MFFALMTQVQRRLSSEVMALITSDCIDGPNHLGLHLMALITSR